MSNGPWKQDYKPSCGYVTRICNEIFAEATHKEPDQAKIHRLNIRLISNRIPKMLPERVKLAYATIRNLERQIDEGGSK